VEVDAQQPAGVPDGWTVISGGKTETPTSATPAPLPDVSAHAGVPARGRGTQLDLDKSNRGYELATTPLARPTGVDAIDSFTSPVGLVSLAAGGVGIARAGVAGGAAAAAKTAFADAAPIIKYQVIESTLQHFGMPLEIAQPLAMGLAGFKKGTKAAAAEAGPAAAADAPHLDRSVPVRAGSLTPQQLKERVFNGTGVAPPTQHLPKPAAGVTAQAAAEIPTPTAETLRAESRARFDAAQAIRTGPDGQLVGRPGGNPDLPDVKARSEARLTELRAAFKAKQAAAAETPDPRNTPSDHQRDLTDLIARKEAAIRASAIDLTPDEVQYGEALLKKDPTLTLADVKQRVLALRESAAFQGMPSTADARAAIAARKYKS
jgi:hypothetical protein